MIIKVGYLLSYDFKYIKTSLPKIYDCDDITEIYLAYDENNKTWSGNDANIDSSFFDWIKEFDKKNKIKLYKDNFFIPSLSSIECDTRERNLLAQQMGDCDWYIQIDSDEYVVDIKGLIDKLKKISFENPDEKISVTGKFLTLFKENKGGFFAISPIQEDCWLATNNPQYEYARVNWQNKKIEINNIIVHQSWAREEGEILQKIKNWGHNNDFDTQIFFEMWEKLDNKNYKNYKNFHPLTGKDWKKLIFLDYTIDGLLNKTEKEIYKYFRESVFSKIFKK